MCYKELYNILRFKLASFIDMKNIDIYFCLGSIECLKKNLAITNDNDVKWVYHITTLDVEQHIVLIVRSAGLLSISMGSSFSNSFQTEIHSDGGCFYWKHTYV